MVSVQTSNLSYKSTNNASKTISPKGILISMNFPTHIPASKASTQLLKDLILVRDKLQGVEDSTSPTIDRINPLRKIDQELSLRLLHFLSAEMNIPLRLPENMPNGDDAVEEAMF